MSMSSAMLVMKLPEVKKRKGDKRILFRNPQSYDQTQHIYKNIGKLKGTPDINKYGERNKVQT